MAGDLSGWYHARYLESVALGTPEGGAKFRAMIASFPVPGVEGFPMSGRIRMFDFMKLKYKFALSPEGYTCLVMRAAVRGVSSIYAYAYWRPAAEEPEYLCISPTFESRDGEYRARFVCYGDFVKACADFASLLEPFEQAALTLLADKMQLETLVCGTTSAPVARRAAELRLGVLTLAVALLIDLWFLRVSTLMAHTNADYLKLLKIIAVAVPEAWEATAAVTLHTLHSFLVTLGVEPGQLRCGQKLAPASVREVMQLGDHNYAAWREAAVAHLAGDLVLNFISPAFPFYNQWTPIEGAEEAVFDSAAVRARYTRARTAARATLSLREARRALAAPDTQPEGAYHTAELNAHIYESIEYAQSFLLLAPVVIVHLMEDVGMPLLSYPAFVRRHPILQLPAVELFASRDTTARYLFDLAYGAHCLHTKVGVAHTDLHGNNMTVYAWGGTSAESSRDPRGQPTFYEDPVMAYVAGSRGEADTYIFPAAGLSGCLIDFGRSILGPAFRPRLEAGRPPAYAVHFYRDQTNRVVRALHRYAPVFVEKNELLLRSAIFANFAAVFPVLCAVDFIAIGRSVAAALSTPDPADPADLRGFAPDPAGVALAARLEREGRVLLLSGLSALVAQERRGAPPAFPGATLLEKVFGDWLYPAWSAREPRRARSAQLVDAYNYNNLLQYSGEDYARYPPWAQLEVIEPHLGKYRLADILGRPLEPFLEALVPGGRAEALAEQTRAAEEGLDGKPVATTSSWIGE